MFYENLLPSIILIKLCGTTVNHSSQICVSNMLVLTVGYYEVDSMVSSDLMFMQSLIKQKVCSAGPEVEIGLHMVVCSRKVMDTHAHACVHTI
jgi:hypothetical protein